MTLNDYQQAALKTAVYPNIGHNLNYAVLGLVGECGEIANKLKKVHRDDGGVLTEERRKQLGDELFDALWYVADVAMELGMDLEAVAQRGLAKLAARAEAGTLHGQGDQR